jgi:hypothetical protein
MSWSSYSRVRRAVPTPTGAPFVARACWSSGPPSPSGFAIRRTLRLWTGRSGGKPYGTVCSRRYRPGRCRQNDALPTQGKPVLTPISRLLYLHPNHQSASASNETGAMTNTQRRARKRAHRDGGGRANGTVLPNFTVMVRLSDSARRSI